MAEESLRERASRLKLAGRESDNRDDRMEEEAGEEAGTEEAVGPPEASDHWRALYARVREVTEKLRQ
ncbi:hypothetical protein ACFQZE_00285 [Paenibacillus sp. GCM10027627]|uniref:hypothetical protein n=1 Tax=unclassified Paenibacillus TaxID=185978 RepID=UPI0036320840